MVVIGTMEWIDVNERLPEPIIWSELVKEVDEIDEDTPSDFIQKQRDILVITRIKHSVLDDEDNIQHEYSEIAIKFAMYVYDDVRYTYSWYGTYGEILFWAEIPEYPDVDLMEVKGLNTFE